MVGKQALKKGAKQAIKTGAKTAGKEAAEMAKSSIKDKALNYGMGALDALSGGPDEEEDGSWTTKLSNLGATAGSVGGGLALGAAGSVVPGAGTVAGGLAGGAAGGFLGRKAGKFLGTIIDKFTGGDKIEAVKLLAKMITTNAIPGYALVKVANLFSDNDDEKMFSDLLSSTKSQVPTEYKDELEDAIDATED